MTPTTTTKSKPGTGTPQGVPRTPTTNSWAGRDLLGFQGVPASRVDTVDAFGAALKNACREKGPHLIEVVL